MQSSRKYRLHILYSLFGYSRQAYHQHFISDQQQLFNEQIIVEQVHIIRNL